MAGMVTQGNWLAISSSQPTLGAENQELFAPNFIRIPAHPRILGPAEQVAAGPIEQHLLVDGQFAGRPGRMSLKAVNFRCSRVEDRVFETHDSIEASPWAETMENCGFYQPE